MKIRLARVKDYDELHALEQEWVREGISPFMSNTTRDEFYKEMRSASVFVAVDERIIGYLVCKIRVAKEDNTMHSIKKGDKYADIDSLYVLAKHRGRGIGTKLLKHCLKELERVGYKSIILSADSKEMNRLVNFYKKNGFKVVFTRMMLDVK